MQIHITKPLFAWDCLEDSPSITTIRKLLQAVPDAKLLESLRRHRGKGRDDYPVEVCWGVLLLTIALRHREVEACLAELRRNEGLRRLLGIESEEQVPKAWNMSRFLDRLGEEPHRTLLHQIFGTMVERLAAVVPDLGRTTAGDATGLSARRKDDDGAKPEIADGLPQATGGRKEYTDDDGRVTEVVEWFGFKLHLLVDTRHELALDYKITDTKAGDAETLPEVLAGAEALLPAGRIETLAFDKAADTNEVHELLSQKKITPVIQMRSLWKEEPERLLPGHDGTSNIVYDEAGTVYCYDRTSNPPVRHAMSYIRS
jgi:hypothetical protein